MDGLLVKGGPCLPIYPVVRAAHYPIAGAWLEGHPLTLLGGVEVAPRIGELHDLGATIATIHTWLSDAILWLAGVHAIAALCHHFVLKDRVLLSMLPRISDQQGRELARASVCVQGCNEARRRTSLRRAVRATYRVR
jgi:hypothetical protein